jgi:23S rRNA pseudouridine2605 synthase
VKQDRPKSRPPAKRSPAKRTPLKRAPVKRVAPLALKKRPLPISSPPASKGPKALLKTLDRVLSKAGLGSRTEARSWIGGNRVRVNGLLVQTPDYWVNLKTDKVTLDGNSIDTVERRYILLNKPKGYITTYKDPEGRPTVYDLLKGVEQFLGTVGRLDLDTSGLLLLTNDTDLAEAVTNPAYKLEKTYLVKAATLLSEEHLDRLRKGVELNDGLTQPAEVVVIRQSEKHTFLEITITEGRNRQVRRMLEAVESKVLKLVRVSLGPLTLEGLPIGTWRDLTEAEVARLASGRVRPRSKPPAPSPDEATP